VTDARVCVGVVTGPHGVRGLVKVKSFMQVPEDLVELGQVTDKSGARTFRLDVRGMNKGALLVHVDGIDDRDAAQALKGLELYVPRDALPEPENDEFYHADLIGLRVELEDGTVIGSVRAVHDFGAGDVIELHGKRPWGTVMLPFDAETVPTVDVAAGRLVVRPPEGLVSDAQDDEQDEEDAGKGKR
jgi:16S rRNA processing protein RimM